MPDFRELVREYHAIVYRVALGVLRDEAAAEDVAQDVFLAFLQDPAALARASSLKSFVCRTALNRALDALKAGRRRAAREAQVAERSGVMDPSEAAFRRELRERVAELPEDQRAAVDLHYFQGLTLPECAAALAVPEGTVSSRVSAALSKLRAVLAGAATAGLLLALEGNLRACEPAAVPEGLEGRLQRLGRGAPGVPTASGRGARLILAGTTVLTIVLVAIIGSVTYRAMRGGPARTSSVVSQGATAHAGVPETAATATAPDDAGIDFASVDRDLDLHGIVVSEAQAPIAGAELRTLTEPWRRATLRKARGEEERVGGPAARSARDGTFRIRLRRGEEVALRASAAGFAAIEVKRCLAGGRVRIVMKPGVTVEVRARDPEGQPLARAQIRIGGDAGEENVAFAAKGDTDEAGLCLLAGLPSGCVAELSGVHLATGGAGKATLRLPARGNVVADLTLPRLGTVRGRVFDGVTHRSIPGASIRAHFNPAFSALADADGRFEIRGVETGWLWVDVAAEGYAPEAVTPESTDDVEVMLFPAFAVAGRAVDDSGSPVRDARFAAFGGVNSGGGCEIVARDRAGDDGRFRIGGLDARASYTLSCEAPGRGRILLDFDFREPTAGIRDLGDIVLPASRSIEGVVLTAEGAPLDGVTVTIEGGNIDRARLRNGVENWDWPIRRADSRRTDDLGRFRFPDLSPGLYNLIANKGRSRAGAEMLVELKPESNRSGLEIRMPAGRDVSVVVVDEAGQPVEGVMVLVDLEGKLGLGGDTDVSGVARFTLGGPARVTILVSRTIGTGPWVEPEPRTLDGDAAEIRFVLETGKTITGRVLAPGGKPLPKAGLRALIGEKVVAAGNARDDGSFRLVVRSAAVVDVELTGDYWLKDGGAFEGRVTGVRAGADDIVVHAVPMEANRSLRVRIEFADGRPAAGAWIILNSRGDAQKATADENGSAVFDGLVPKGAEIQAGVQDPGDGVAWQDAIEDHIIPSGQEVVIRLEVGVRVAGVVLGPSGEPIAGAHIVIRAAGFWEKELDSGSKGRFTAILEAGARGGFTLQATHPGEAGTLLTGVAEGVVGGGDVTVRLEPAK
ncbi:MAG: sigma-70 family RNA polymerase sigma factor [Planctomycetes bacterium]|nr:sigma-70 family RNA polymerase sigma factor [Planctomycetota bacterium]